MVRISSVLFLLSCPNTGELTNLCRSFSEPDYTKGLFQSIGFKEFHENLVLPSVEQRQQLLDQGVDALKTATRRYARKQIKWINHRFLMQPDRQASLFLRFAQPSLRGK